MGLVLACLRLADFLDYSASFLIPNLADVATNVSPYFGTKASAAFGDTCHSVEHAGCKIPHSYQSICSPSS